MKKFVVDKRPWPIIGAIGTLIIITGLIKWFHLYNQELILIAIIIIILTIIQWWKDKDNSFYVLINNFYIFDPLTN